ncbi:MAG: hypothetical protein ACRECZ_07065 [Methylocella sp.]
MFDETLKVYFTAFAEPDRSRRKALLLRCLTEDAEIWGPSRFFKGHESISDKIDGFQSRNPGARLVLASGISTFRNIARLDIAIIGADGSLIDKGDSVTVFAEDGRISRIFPSWGALPPVPESWPRHLVK